MISVVKRFMNPHANDTPSTLLGKTTCRPPSLRDPQWQGTPGDGRGATTVSSPRETVEKETADQPPPPERR